MREYEAIGKRLGHHEGIEKTCKRHLQTRRMYNSKVTGFVWSHSFLVTSLCRRKTCLNFPSFSQHANSDSDLLTIIMLLILILALTQRHWCPQLAQMCSNLWMLQKKIILTFISFSFCLLQKLKEIKLMVFDDIRSVCVHSQEPQPYQSAELNVPTGHKCHISTRAVVMSHLMKEEQDEVTTATLLLQQEHTHTEDYSDIM